MIDTKENSVKRNVRPLRPQETSMKGVFCYCLGNGGDGFFASSSVSRFVSSQRIVVKSVGGG